LNPSALGFSPSQVLAQSASELDLRKAQVKAALSAIPSV